MDNSDLLLVLGNKAYSSWSLRPWLLMKQFDLAFEEKILPLDTPEFEREIAAHSPSRRVPSLKHGEMRVWDSLAICEYVNEAFLAGAGWPKEIRARALARACASEMHSGFQALRAECPMNVRRPTGAIELSAQAQKDIARIQEIWSELRNAHAAAGPFLFGAFSIADAFFAPVASRFRTYAVPLPPLLQEYASTLLGLPAMQEWTEAARHEPNAIARYEAIA